MKYFDLLDSLQSREASQICFPSEDWDSIQAHCIGCKFAYFVLYILDIALARCQWATDTKQILIGNFKTQSQVLCKAL